MERDIVVDRDDLPVEDRIGLAVVHALRQHCAVCGGDDDGAKRIEWIGFGRRDLPAASPLRAPPAGGRRDSALEQTLSSLPPLQRSRPRPSD